MSNQSLLKPARLCAGDTVAVLSPSWGGPSRFPHIFDLGLRNLRDRFGLRIKEFPTARMDADESYRNPKLRAEDLNRAFADPEVKAIVASIGGDDSVRILPFLNVETIMANPKILMGYSDTTAITTFLNTLGLVTFNGPTIMAGFAQMAFLPEAFEAHVRAVLMEPASQLTYTTYDSWTDHYLDWHSAGAEGQIAPLTANNGPRWLQGDGRVEGRLFGGCIEVLEFLKGTRFWPDPDFWAGKILFFETSEDKPTVSNVKYMLRNYGSMSVLDQISGILFGRARSYSDAEKMELENMLVQIVTGEFGRSDMPIVANCDFGHTDPQWILPLGVRLEIDSQPKSLTLLEPAVL